MLCILVFTYYLYVASNRLLSRHTATSCRFHQTAKFPDFTICSSYVHAYCSRSLNQADYHLCELNLLNHTTDIIYSLVPSILNAVHNITYQGNALKFDARQFLKNGNKCAQLKFNSEIRDSIVVSVDPEKLYRVYSHLNEHGFSSYPYDSPEFNLGKPQLQLTFMTSFQTVKVISLQSPYATDCFDYNTVNWSGPEQCLQHCLMFNSNISDYRYLTVPDDKYMIHNLKYLSNTSSNCLQKCSRPACITETFLKHGVVLATRQIDNMSYLRFNQITPIMEIEYEPLFSSEVYFIYVSGLLSSCLGICSLSLEYLLMKIVKLRPIVFRVPINERYLKYAVGFISVCGCIWQLTLASQTYFNYETITEVYIGLPLTIESPAISYCFAIDEILENDYRNLYTNLNSIRYDKLNLITLNRTQLVIAYEFHGLAVNGSWINYFKGGFKCFYFRLSDSFVANPSGFYMLAHTNASAKRIYLHPSDDYPRLDFYKPKLTYMKYYSYSYISHQLLPYPFSNCIEGYETQAQCFERCFKSRIGTTLHADSLVTVPEDLYNEYFYSSLSTHENSATETRDCTKTCERRNCNAISYSINDERGQLNKGVPFGYYITHPIQITSFNLVVKLNTIEYILYIASILGFWLNFNLMLVFNMISYIRRICYSKTKQTPIFLSEYHGRNKKRTSKDRIKIISNFSVRIAFVFLITGFLYQSYDMCDLYLLRQTITETTISTAAYFKIPTFSVCFVLCYVYNGTLNSNQCENTISTYSAQHLNRITYSDRQLIENMVILDPEHYNATRITGQTIDTYYMGGLKCVRISVPNQRFLSFAKFIHARNSRSSSIDISISEQNVTIPGTYMFIHKVNTYAPFSNLASKTLAYDKEHTLIDYSIVKTILLPFPYSTNCRNYIHSRQQCIENCMQIMSRSLLNKSLNYLIRRDYDIWPADDREDHNIESFRKFCSEQTCRKSECNTEIFKANIAHRQDTTDTVISIAAPITVSRSEYFPKLTLFDFIIYFCGLFGLWFRPYICL